MIKRRQVSLLKTPFFIFFCTPILLFIVLIIVPGLSFKPVINNLIYPNITVENKIYLNSLPEPDQVLASNPINIVINLKNRIVEGSEILILQGNKKVSSFPTQIDIDQITLRQLVKSNIPDGAYTVIYKLCTAPKVCDNGNFNFYINRKLSQNYPVAKRSKLGGYTAGLV